MSAEPQQEVREFLAEFPDTQAVDVIFADLSGVVRGKRYPVADLTRIYSQGLAFPASSFLLDTAGANTDAGGDLAAHDVAPRTGDDPSVVDASEA